MAYVEIPDADVAIDAFGKTTNVFKRLRDNIRALRVCILAWIYTVQSTTSTSFVTLDEKEVWIPNVDGWTALQRSFVHRFQARVNAGTGTYRLRDDASTETGDEVTTTATSNEWKEATIDVDPSWIGTMRTLQLQAKATSGNTAYATSDNNVASRLNY